MVSQDGWRVEQLERKIDGLAAAVAEVKTDVAVLTAGMARIERDVQTAQSERAKIATELGAYGIQLTRFTSSIDNVEKSISFIKPQVAELRESESEREGAVKAATWAGKIITGAWMIGSGIVGAILALVSYFAAGGRAPGSH